MDGKHHLCFYCGLEKTFTNKVEHIIPTAIGGTQDHRGSAPPVLTTNSVCDDCNQKAGREIDQPFVETLAITALRSLVGAKNRGKRPPLLPLPGRLVWERPEIADALTQGAFTFVRLRDSNGEVFVEHYCPDDPNAIAPEVRAQMDEIADTMVKKSLRLGTASSSSPKLAELHQLFTDAYGTSNPKVRFKSTTAEEPGALLREAAKIVLGVLCGLFAEFASSDAARSLRALAFKNKTAVQVAHDLEIRFSGPSMFAFSQGSPAPKHRIGSKIDRGATVFRTTFYDGTHVEFQLDLRGFAADFNGEIIYELDPISKQSVGIRVPFAL